ncbi:jg9417 [Pararge aegeria aegeria]|uniref:Jg9417 protein n=1 Tax=Pararge aegeria aegeria TaxID=348720 RepID=A0A8S4R7F3_9NEOP|nr:jg9417 [Pararge aegeria aegeria]
MPLLLALVRPDTRCLPPGRLPTNQNDCWGSRANELGISPELVSAALVGPQRGGQTTLSASQVAAGSKRLRTVELGTPYKRPMSSSGRLSVDVMLMMMNSKSSKKKQTLLFN